ncbi:uncharacterized protein B0I36DRAFT_121681 [Microdochium trichocladiopsis]|uniref:Uncharacterized protein n=1 Tax=Microdochium trichocladiopsis TaxID=1682393 RepID=A0A9P9BNK1_9PEZI|nr:uncharacterized protein B0I36DRAFT_121681 [Microdochium trichocladiopsis]KAH7031336.1 hypothetical protein B0I36DRAFT_121681 [Microdochium trichocladiopsis]
MPKTGRCPEARASHMHDIENRHCRLFLTLFGSSLALPPLWGGRTCSEPLSGWMHTLRHLQMDRWGARRLWDPKFASLSLKFWKTPQPPPLCKAPPSFSLLAPREREGQSVIAIDFTSTWTPRSEGIFAKVQQSTSSALLLASTVVCAGSVGGSHQLWVGIFGDELRGAGRRRVEKRLVSRVGSTQRRTD